ncbi:MAG: hypothetical protein ACP5XB_06290, partial [Isosphaeraceae bacterium]
AADHLGQLGPGVDHSDQGGGAALAESSIDLRRVTRSSARHRSSPSPLRPSDGTRRVKARRAHQGGHAPGHDHQHRSPVYGIQPSR